ncbi:MAG: SDR family oxidoreductase, partial [Sciscionella sp.]
VSTDYVFDGTAETPYAPQTDRSPRSVYGASKAAGELAVLESGAQAWIVRTAWVYSAHGSNFVKTMARLARSGAQPRVVDDQVGTPTWTADLAAGLLELAEAIGAGTQPEQRILHCVGGGQCSWFTLARAVFAELGADPLLVSPCSTQEFPRPAPRPHYSVLDMADWLAAGLAATRDWRVALTAAFARDGESLRGSR